MNRMTLFVLLFLAVGRCLAQDIVSAQQNPFSTGSVDVTFSDGKVVCVPPDPSNRHCLALHQWVRAGNTVARVPVETAEARRTKLKWCLINLIEERRKIQEFQDWTGKPFDASDFLADVNSRIEAEVQKYQTFR